jgi:S1-C subfamily serine protease
MHSESFSWQHIQQQAQHAVVQVINHSVQIDDLAPFRRGGAEGRGSGFIIEGGYVVTNFHVIQNCIRLFIQMPLIFGNQRFEVSLVGSSPDSDLALLKISEDDQKKIREKYGILPYLELGDSSLIERSDELLGIGFPLGQSSPKSATGVVSGFQSITLSSGSIYIIQVTKPSNPGNSGGPLFNTLGQVVGIDVAGPGIATDNIAYAIPINDFAIIKDALLRGETVHKTYLGASYCPARDQEIAQLLHNPTPAGCYITDVLTTGLFYNWGLQAGDMLYEINGLTIDPYGCIDHLKHNDRKPVGEYILGFPLGTVFHLVWYRYGERIEKDVSLLFKPQPKIAWRSFDYAVDYEIIGGLLLQELSLNIIEALSKAPAHIQANIYPYQVNEAKRNESVIIVTQILAGSLAAESLSIGTGEIITHINGSVVGTLEDVRKALLEDTREFISIENNNGDLIVFKKTDLYAHEPRIAGYFGYQITPGMNALLYKKILKKRKNVYENAGK